MADFQNCLISAIFGVFSGIFLHKTTPIFLSNGFSRIFGIFNFGPKVTVLQMKAISFAWAIAFARWPIFKIVSVLKYFVFFRAVFCKEQL